MFSPNCNNTQVITFSQKLHFLFTQIVKQLTSLELHINSPNCKFTNISLLEWIFVWMDLCLIGFVFKSIYFWYGYLFTVRIGPGDVFVFGRDFIWTDMYFQVPSGPWDRNHYWDGFVFGQIVFAHPPTFSGNMFCVSKVNYTLFSLLSKPRPA